MPDPILNIKRGFDMNSRLQQNLFQLAQDTGLSLDPQSGALFGTYGGYSIALEQIEQSWRFTISVSVKCGGRDPDVQVLRQAAKAERSLQGCTVHGRQVTFQTKNRILMKNGLATAKEALDAAVNILRQTGCVSCCKVCGAVTDTRLYYTGGTISSLCADCSQQISLSADNQAQVMARQHENVIGGIVGALIGSLIGAACILIISQLGYIAAISGVVMGVCTVKGYELLGRKISRKGIVISGVIMLAVVFLSNQADWAIAVAKYFEMDFFTAFRAVPELLEAEAIEASTYYGDLALLYVFTLLGAVPTMRNALKTKAVSNLVYPLGDEPAVL